MWRVEVKTIRYLPDLELVFVVVCYDGDTEVSVLAEQWSSLQLGAHLDLLLTLTLTVSYQSPDC